MTPFKKRLNRELGETSFFTKELQQKIIHNAQQPPKRKRHWQYPVVLISTLAIILFLMMIGPWDTVTPSNETLNALIQKQSVSQFSMESNWGDDTFKAVRVGRVIGQKDFQQGPETKILEQVLQHAQQSEVDTDYISFRDVWIQFEAGQIAKIKMKSKDEQLAFVDFDTGLFYNVDDEAATNFIVFLNEYDQQSWYSNSIFFVLFCMFFLRWLVEKIVQATFHIQKDPKYITKGHQIATITGNIVYLCIFSICILNSWFLYYVVFISIVVTVSLSRIMIEYYYGREEKRHYIAISDTIVIWISLVIYFMSMNV